MCASAQEPHWDLLKWESGIFALMRADYCSPFLSLLNCTFIARGRSTLGDSVRVNGAAKSCLCRCNVYV